MRSIFVLLLAGMVALAPSARSQSVQRIAVVVNDEVISVRDLRDRIRLVLFLSGIRDTAESRRRIANQVLRSLIDERLQLQEAKRRGLSVSDREISQNVLDVERANRMKPESLPSVLADNRVSYGSLRAQIRARIAWSKLVHRRLAPRVVVGEEEVAEVLARLKATEGEDAWRLGEIFLPVNKPDDEAAVRETARRMVEQIREGARFGTLAGQFSQTATAAVGGDLGWTARSELDPEVAAAVERLAPGAVSDPIRTDSGFRILTLIESRKVATGNANAATLDLKQIFVPVADGGDPARAQARLDRVRSEGRAIDGCEDLSGVARRLGAEAPRDRGTLKRADLSAEMWKSVVNVGVGQAGSPIRVPGGIVLTAVCGRTLPKSELPDRGSVTQRLRERRLGLAAQRYLRDLRSAAVVDLRV